MPLLPLLSRDYTLPDSPQNVIAIFRNRERSILSLFWSLYTQVSLSKSCLVVIDDKEDLEYFNYLLSKYGLKEISLIIDNPREINSAQLHTRIKDGQKLSGTLATSQVELKRITSQLTALIADTKEKTERLHIPQLGSLSVVNINDNLELGSGDKVDVEQAILKPPYTYQDYSNKKALFQSIEKIYDINYHFIKRQDPFTPSILNEVSESDLRSVLKDQKLKAYDLLENFNTIYHKVLNYYRGINIEETEKIKLKVSIIADTLSKNESINDTEILKLLNQQKELYRILRIPSDSPQMASELLVGLVQIKKAMTEKSQSDYTNTQDETQRFLEQLTSSNPEFPELEDLITQVNSLAEAVKSAEIFKVINLRRSVTFGFQKANLQEIIDQLEYAQFFLEQNPHYLEWKKIEKNLSHEDKAIVDYLAKQSDFWGKAFEKLFLQYYLNHSEPLLDSAQNNHKNFDHLIKQYIKHYPSSIIKKALKSVGIAQDKWPEIWSDYLGDNAKSLQDRFPILVVGSTFYKQHSPLLVPSTDTIIFLNTVPKEIIEENWLQHYFVGYSADFKEHSSYLPSQLSGEFMHHKDDKISYTINRGLSSYNLAEANTAARYLGQEMHIVSSRYRMFQLRNVSIISYWSPIKNATLLQELEAHGVKEIISTEQDQNLLPGILANKEETTFLLLEDNLFTHEPSSNIIEQLLLLEELTTAGIKVLSIDNYKMINAGAQTLGRAIRRITQTQAIPVAHATA